MPNLNKVFLAGHLTRDPELKYTGSGTALCTAGLAVNSKYQHNGEWKEEVCFIDVVAFGKLAEVFKDCRKGQAVLVAGRLDFQTWQAEGGQKRSKHQVRAEMIMSAADRQDGKDDDIPF